MSYITANNAVSTLASGINNSVTTLSIQVADISKFPAINNGGLTPSEWGLITIQNASGSMEICKVTRHDSGSSSLTVVRAYEDSSRFPAASWLAGDSVSMRMTAAVVNASLAHPAATTGAHAASAISVTPTGAIASTDVQSALAEIDTEKQPANANLTAFSGLSGVADRIAYFTGAGALALSAISSFVRSTFLNVADAVAARAAIGAAASGANSDITSLSALVGPGLNPVGTIIYSAAKAAPSGYLVANGANVSRTTYAALFAVICPTIGTAGISNGAGAIVTCNGHGLMAGDLVSFTTTASLPTGLTPGTSYFVAGTVTANTFQLSATSGGALITTSSAGSGVHTLISNPFGTVAADTANFQLPDLRGEFIRGWNSTGSGLDANRVFGAAQADQFQGHEHYYNDKSGWAYPQSGGSQYGNPAATATTGVVTDGTNGTPRAGSETRPVNISLLPCIKT